MFPADLADSAEKNEEGLKGAKQIPQMGKSDLFLRHGDIFFDKLSLKFETLKLDEDINCEL